MKVTRLEEEFPFTTSEGRSEGVHLSDIIKSIMVTLYGKDYDKEIDDLTRLRFEQGFLWEVALSRAFGAKGATRPSEINQDGVAMSPDGIGDYEGTPVVEEYKCTTKSSNHDISDQIAWMMQVKGYCHAMGYETAIFRILFINGDYKDRNPHYRVYRLDFSRLELQENWDAIINHGHATGMLKGDN